MSNFKFNMYDHVTNIVDKTCGMIVGRTEFVNDVNYYHVQIFDDNGNYAFTDDGYNFVVYTKEDELVQMDEADRLVKELRNYIDRHPHAHLNICTNGWESHLLKDANIYYSGTGNIDIELHYDNPEDSYKVINVKNT